MSWTLSQLAEALEADVLGDPDLVVTGAADPAVARADQIAVALSPKMAEAVAASNARAAIVWPGADLVQLGLDGALAMQGGGLGLVRVTQALDPDDGFWPGQHPSAAIHETARIGEGVDIGPFAVIGPNVVIGAGTRIGPQVNVAAGARVGAECRLHAGAKVGQRCQIGDRVTLQMNAAIGPDGFSFKTVGVSHEETVMRTIGRKPLTPPEDGTRHKAASLGGVILGDDVEVGANSAIDAGTLRPTVVGRGTKIDNLVHIGHNCIIGEDTLLCGMVGIAGSSIVGDRVIFAGQTGLADHRTVGNDVLIAAGTKVLSDVPDGSVMQGYPARPMAELRREQKGIKRLLSGLS